MKTICEEEFEKWWDEKKSKDLLILRSVAAYIWHNAWANYGELVIKKIEKGEKVKRITFRQKLLSCLLREEDYWEDKGSGKPYKCLNFGGICSSKNCKLVIEEKK